MKFNEKRFFLYTFMGKCGEWGERRRGIFSFGGRIYDETNGYRNASNIGKKKTYDQTLPKYDHHDTCMNRVDAIIS